jgi:outer membrane receptor for ferrienterochelin and colicin
MPPHHFHLHLFRASLLGFMFMLPLSTVAQTASPDTTIQMNQLGRGDIVDRKAKVRNKIFSANRIEEDVDEQAMKTYVITQEEILANGYSTLVDILKTIPGFRVSQPGSALLGETFVMRGLLGNNYCKILINGQSIVPSAAPGMPLGAQLPIKQAERIEIILGPISSLYGADAMAGVINIVLPEVEQAVEAMASASASLKIGGTNDLNIGLGGKFGTKDNVVKYSFFGSSRQIENLPLDTENEIFEVDSFTQYENPLFKGNNQGQARIEELPHESRLLGLQLEYRDLKFSYQTMYRSDHSALGSHPSEVSYTESGFFVAERINNLTGVYENQINRQWWVQSTFSWLDYEMDNNSSYEGVAHPLSNGRNHMYAASDDYKVEQLVSYSVKRFNFLAGANYKFTDVVSFQSYLERPYDPDAPAGSQVTTSIDPQGNEISTIAQSQDDFSLVDSTDVFNEFDQVSYAGFLQSYYRGEKLSVVAAVRYDLFKLRDSNEAHPSFRVGLNYKLTKKTTLRGYYGQGFRYPQSYVRDNNYTWTRDTINPGGLPTYNRGLTPLAPEKFVSVEGGVVHQFDDNWRVEAQFFRHKLENSLFPVLNYTDLEELLNWGTPPTEPPTAPTTNRTVGFTNLESESVLRSVQLGVCYENDKISVALDGQYNQGEEKFSEADDIDGYRNVPAFMGYLKVQASFGAGYNVGLNAMTASSFIAALAIENGDEEAIENDGYYNIDLVLGKKFTDNFRVYFRINNITGTDTRGIFSNALTGYNFAYIPQYTRTFQFGLTYTLN